MRFEECEVQGVHAVELERIGDERGFFARTWCEEEFRYHGLDASLTQCNVSFNPTRGTLRGMHYQDAPRPEAKLVRVTRGAIWDVALDLRPESPTFLRWCARELSDENRRAFYIPPGCAHGFITLTDDVEIFYQMSETYYPDLARGVRWDDAAFGIEWPETPTVISERDRSYPDFAVPVR